MADLGFDWHNPPQLSREDRRVAGCSCGGLQWHTQECSIWSMDRAEALAAIDAAEAVVRRHGEMLNDRLRAWEASRG